MNIYKRTMRGGALTALTALTKRDQRSSIQLGGVPTSGVGHSMDVYALSEGERLAAERMFQLLRNQISDWTALLDEWLSESKDRSIWIVLRPRELDRYKQLDVYEPQLRLLLNYESFTELVGAWQAAQLSWEAAPDDFGRLEAWLMLNRLVYMCLGPAHPVTHDLMTMPRARGKKRGIRQPKWFLRKAILSGLPDAGNGQSDGLGAHHVGSIQAGVPDGQPNARQSHG